MADEIIRELRKGAQIQVVEDLGVFVWTPPTLDPTCAVAHTADTILRCLDPDPNVESAAWVRNLRELKEEIHRKSKVNNKNGKLFSDLQFKDKDALGARDLPGEVLQCPRVVPLYVAVKRGLDLGKIDFLLGGSALEALAKSGDFTGGKNDRAHNTYYVESCKGISVVHRSSAFTVNFGSPAYQFKRWACGAPMEDVNHPISLNTIEHLRVFQIGEFRVLVSATLDAVCWDEETGRPEPARIRTRQVEGNELEIIYQLFGCGAPCMTQGCRRGMALQEVRETYLEFLLKRVDPETLALQEMNVITALTRLKNLEMAEGQAYALHHVDGELQITAAPAEKKTP